jgi:hypothetical protein
VLNLRGAVAGAVYYDQIKAKLILRAAIAKHPHTGDPGDIPLLARTDSLQSASKLVRSAGFYLHECHCPAVSDHQIHVVPSQLEPMRLN